MTLHEAERVLSTLRCQICCQSELVLKLRCDLGSPGCETTVQCRVCGYETDVDSAVRNHYCPSDLGASSS